MVRKKKSSSVQRNVALCYIRQSYTRDDDDTNSPERQRANIQALCDRNGWTPEWYEDVGGHKSGRKEKNRPEWLRLKKRLGDSDVVALAANDLARLHRKGWRVGDLVEYLDELDVALVLAAPGREVDTSTPQGRMFLQFSAIIDEYYSEDISQRAKDSIAYRKALGKTIGAPPFGTVRNENGYLIPSPQGAWYLPNGRFAAGEPDEPPHTAALWRSYYKCAHYVLQLYAQGNMGLDKIAYQLNIEGWPFRNRRNEPRPINREDVRRVIANWPEYGGMVTEKKAKERPAYESYDVNAIPFNPDRAIFPIDLVRTVAEVRQARTLKPPDHGENRNTRVYPLSVITYCAHCEQLAIEQSNPGLRSTLTGRTEANGTQRYRHKSGIKCGCTNLSVTREIYENDFARLIRLLTIKAEVLPLMTELAIHAGNGGNPDDADLEQQKREAIALCRRRIDATVHLYSDGVIDRAEYLRRVEQNERQIAHWETRTTETEKAALELAMCMEAVDKIARLWDVSDDEDKQGLVRSLFDYLVYNLDMQRIVDFRLKPWADRFLVLRAALYDDLSYTDEGSSGNKKYPRLEAQGMDTDMPHRGLRGRIRSKPDRDYFCRKIYPQTDVLRHFAA